MSDSSDVAINCRAKVSIGRTGDGSYTLLESGATFATLTITMQELEIRISLKEQQRLDSMC